MQQFRTNRDVILPPLIYGTAWKKEKTAELVCLALKSGFRAIDTACQPKHYNEALVGEGILQSGIQRSEIFIQTKFTPYPGQDPNNIPYDPSASIRDQVLKSFEVSKKNLKTEIIDSLVLHSPMPSLEKTIEVWNVFEELADQKQVLHLGISNCYDADFFKSLYKYVSVRPSVIQNRFYADSGYDISLREFCLQEGIIYQSFWTLTANPHHLESDIMKKLVNRYKLTPAQIFFNLLNKKGIIPLTGTSSKTHMLLDLQAANYDLSEVSLDLFI
ncbi:MAG: aldo/keto reductase [Bacteriovoracaceae bacterium]|nr:aldo/keto reductase [Bacteriovoracaceae bacterium]